MSFNPIIKLDSKAQALIGAVANKEHKLAKIVEELPTEDIDTNTIYMVLDATASEGNVYNEYLYIEEAWELIGTTAVTEISQGYTLRVKNVADCVDVELFLCSYSNNDISITTETITNDGNYHTFNNVFAFGIQYDNGELPTFENQNGTVIECGMIYSSNADISTDNRYELLTNFETEINYVI